MARPEIIVTFPSYGKAANNAFTTIFNPSFLEIILKGLNALKAHNAFNDFNAELPPPDSVIQTSVIEITTTKKSSLFHPVCK